MEINANDDLKEPLLQHQDSISVNITQSVHTQDDKTRTIVFKVHAMEWGSCATSIESILVKLNGIKSVTVSPLQGQAVVKFMPELIKVNLIKESIEDAGFGVDEFPEKDIVVCRIKIKGIVCTSCCESVEHALQMEVGVKKAVVGLSLEEAKVHYDPYLTDTEHIIKAIEGAGFGVVLINSGNDVDKVHLKVEEINSLEEFSVIEASLDSVEGVNHVEMDIKGNKVMAGGEETPLSSGEIPSHNEQMPSNSRDIPSSSLGDIGSVLTQFLLTIQQGQSEQHALLMQALKVTPSKPTGDPFARRIKDFKNLGGSTFSGNQDHIEAEKWLQECEAIFNKMDLTEVQKQEVAVHQLIGPALLWWRSIKGELDLATVTWVTFQERFNNQFIPLAVRSQLREQFIHFTQGNLSVRQYINRFNELSRFAPNLIDTPQRKNDKFIRGLNFYISQGVLAVQNQSFETVMNLALSVEENERRFQSQKRKDRGLTSAGPSRERSDDRFRPYRQISRHPGYHKRVPSTHRHPMQRQQGRGSPVRPYLPALPASPIIIAIPVALESQSTFSGSCWKCHQVGHRASVCPFSFQVGQGNSRGTIGGHRGQ